MTNSKPFPVEDFCFGIIKNDALAITNAEHLILERLQVARLTVCARKHATLSGEQLDHIYQTILDKPYYAPTRKAMAGKDALCLIIGGDIGVADIVQALKGKPERPGTIRGDLSYLREMTTEQYEAYLSGTYTHHKVSGRPIYDLLRVDGRFHSADSYAESRRGISAVFTQAEINTIAARYPAFADFMSQK